MGEQLQQGAILVGKYRFDRLLGEGGMGYVAACTHLKLQEPVALKFLHPELATDPELVARFLREAQAAARIRSEHIVRVHDVGTLENGSPYMVMEYLHGVDLAEMLRRTGPLSIPDAVDYLLEACEALAQAHAMGIVHRDLKPANLFLAELPGGVQLVKVLDFGISKLNAAGEAPSRLTSTKAMLGTPYYMAPEQLTSTRGVDARADIWALGVVLYELLSGGLPFTGDTLAEICVSVLQHVLTPVEALRLGVPPELDAVIGCCLQKERDHRFAHVGDLAVALAPFGSHKAAASTAIITRILPPSPSTASGAGAPAALPVVAPQAPAATAARSGLSSVASGYVSLQGGQLAPVAGASAVVEAGVSVSTMTGPTSWVHTNHHGRRSRPPIVIPIAALALVLAGGAAWWVLSSRTGTHPASTDTASSDSQSIVALAPVPSASLSVSSSVPAVPPVSQANAPAASVATAAPSESARGVEQAQSASGGSARLAVPAQTASPNPVRPSSSAKGTAAAASVPAHAPANAARPAPASKSTAPPRPASTPKPGRTSNALDPETMIDDRR